MVGKAAKRPRRGRGPVVGTSVVDTIVSKLPVEERSNITAQVVRKTNEQLRVLQSKVRVGRLLKKQDRPETRAAALLDFLCRQEEGHKIPMERLAKAAGTTKKTLQTLHEKIPNYLTFQRRNRLLPSSAASVVSSSSSSQQTTTTLSSLPSSPRNASALQSTTTTTTAFTNDTILPFLSIQLGSVVPDSHGCATRAKQLMVDLERTMRRDKHKRHDWLRDLQRVRHAYEAACFSLCAQTEPESLLETAGVSPTEFKTVLETVKELIQTNNGGGGGGMMSSAGRGKKKRGRHVSTQSRQKKVTKRTQTQNPSHDTVQELVTMGSTEPFEPTIIDPWDRPPQHYFYTESFRLWKDQTLKEALTKARETSEEDLTNRQALSQAVDKVLQRRRPSVN